RRLPETVRETIGFRGQDPGPAGAPCERAEVNVMLATLTMIDHELMADTGAKRERSEGTIVGNDEFSDRRVGSTPGFRIHLPHLGLGSRCTAVRGEQDDTARDGHVTVLADHLGHRGWLADQELVDCRERLR